MPVIDKLCIRDRQQIAWALWDIKSLLQLLCFCSRKQPVILLRQMGVGRMLSFIRPQFADPWQTFNAGLI